MKLRLPKILFLVFLTHITFINSQAQSSTYIDEQGVIRWTESNKELCLFGTNYSIPFAYWDAREPIGVDHKKAIDEDVYHISRLGLDGYRIHVWESYISDTLGNLIYNQHFQLFDYLLFKLKERGIKAYITPMYLSGAKSGFPAKYGGSVGCLADTTAFATQENYLSQFVSHINPYTGIAYKNDKDIIAFEIVNEPKHFKRPDLVKSYISRMYDAIRNAGCDKPLFYNMTTCASVIDSVLSTKIQGGSFQWYPTGLTSNHDQKGNLLPNVDRYLIPFANALKESKRPKFVYEFSPADVGTSSHLYPAMARSFREASFQFAAHFAYDPMHAAYCNVEYRTHFLNLAYTPKKAIGLLIASEAFHSIPLGKSYGRYPKNNQFESFSLNYEGDLAQMITNKKFLYTNPTTSIPTNPETLEQIAGTGTSAVVKYDGTGAYFLDKLEDGVWRLEVMPDAQWVHDPFFVPSVQRETAVILWKKHPMSIHLPNLGKEFSIKGLNEGNSYSSSAKDKTFSISPGAYLLTKKGKTSKWNGNDQWKNIQLKEYHAPIRKLEKTYVIHTPPREVSLGKDLQLTAKIVAPFETDQIELIILGVGKGKAIPMNKISPYNYQAVIPAEITAKEQVLRYNISIKKGDHFLTYPAGTEGEYLLDRRIYSDDRILDDGKPYQVRITKGSRPICLFDADKDWSSLTKMNRKNRIDTYSSSIPGKSMIHLSVPNLKKDEHNFSVRSYCRERIETRLPDLKTKKQLTIYGQSLNKNSSKIEISLLMKDGTAYGGIVKLGTKEDYYSINLKDLKKVKSVLLPRPFPKFHAHWFEPSENKTFDLNQVESVQFSIGPGLAPSEYSKKQEISIGWIILE